jgi:hypothetical protein
VAVFGEQSDESSGSVKGANLSRNNTAKFLNKIRCFGVRINYYEKLGDGQ